MHRKRYLLVPAFLIVVAIVMFSPLSWGTEKDYDVLENKMFTTKGKHGLGTTFITSFGNALTSHSGATLTYCYHFMDSLALELHGGYDFSAKYSKLKDAAAKTAPSGLDDQSSDVTDMDLLKYMAQLGVQWAPLYGKLNLTSELDIHVNWFINAGLGIAGVQRKLFQKSKAKTSEVVPAGNFGTGFRFFITKHWVARFEVKNYLFWNSVETVTKDLTNASAPSQRSTDTDFVNVLFLGFGAGYIF